MNPRLALILALALFGASSAPTPLVVGTVRDQHGVALEGALVRVRSSDGHIASARTGPDGTFAVEVAGAVEATVTCAYCKPTTAAVDQDGSFVTIVTRYSAVASPQLASADVRHVPAEDAASILALTPFVVLNRSSKSLPGPQLTDRGVSEQGGLTLIDGMPSYDFVSNLSPYYTIPRRYTGNVHASPEQDAYVYDDGAYGGTFFVDASDGTALFGGGVGGVQHGLLAGAVQVAGAYSNEPDWRTLRVMASTQGGTRDVIGGVAVSGANGDVSDPASALDTSLTSARFFLEHARGIDAGIDGWLDRGTYAVANGAAYSAHARWSDVAARLFVRSHAVVAPFGQFSYVLSSGWLGAPSMSIASNLAQTRGSVGVTVTTPKLDAIVQSGITHADFGSGPGGPPVSYDLPDGVIGATFRPSSRWSIESSLSKGYRLPTLLTEYASPYLPDDSYTDRDRTLEATASYTDNARIRVAFTALSRLTAGLDEGPTTSVGAAIAWQIAPQLSLRAWSLHVAPDLIRKPAARFGVLPQAATPASAWLTYDNRSMRIDLIWQRTLVDWIPSSRLSAAVSGPLTKNVQWFVANEGTLHGSAVDAGIRF